MSFMKELVVPFLLLIGLNQAISQPLNRPSRAMNIAAAETALENKNYYGAIDFFREAYNEEKDDELYRKMAFCYYKIRDYNRSRLYYNRLLRKMPEGKYDMYYEWGRMNKMLGNYEEARKAFRPALSAPGDSLKWLAEQELKGMVLAEDLREDPKFKVYNAGDIINKRFGELSPVIHTDSTLYFSEIDANRPIEIKQNKSSEKAKIMTVELGAPVNQLEKTRLESPINEGNFNIGGLSFSPDGNFMYYQRVDLRNSEVESTRLFVSIRNDEGQWMAGRELRLPSHWVMLHSSFSVYAGKAVVFFSAEIPGGYGGLDLYYAPLERNSIGAPVNLGPKINSPGDEITPFFQGRELYFSSTGWPGLGGLDVFFSKWTGGDWTNPVNLAPPINSRVDDFYLKWTKDWRTGTLLSNRPGGHFLRSETCCDDIYMVERKPVAIAVEFETFSDKFQLKDVQVTAYLSAAGQFEKAKEKSSSSYTHFFSLDGESYYKFVAIKEGHYPDSMIINTVGIKSDTVLNYSFVLPPVDGVDGAGKDGEEIVRINQPIRLNNIYYDFDDDEILPDAEDDLSYLLELLNDYPEMIIELSSHTDARGSDAYNKELSQRRAKSAKKWLVDRGVNPGRIRAIGYGETQLLNKCENGVSCTDEEHRVNRRTEFKILEGPTEIIIERKRFEKKEKKNSEASKRKEDNAPGPRIKFERTFHDLGEVERGATPEFEYSFTNTGTDDLLIEIVTGCECTEIEWTTEAIAPGEKGVIRARLVSADKETDGQHNFDIDVVSNTAQLSHLLEYRAKIITK